jgi:hypothetical protein
LADERDVVCLAVMKKFICQRINKLMDGFEWKGGVKVGDRGTSRVITDDSKTFGL